MEDLKKRLKRIENQLVRGNIPSTSREYRDNDESEYAQDGRYTPPLESEDHHDRETPPPEGKQLNCIRNISDQARAKAEIRVETLKHYCWHQMLSDRAYAQAKTRVENV